MNTNGEIKVRCRSCHVEMIRVLKSRRHDIINMCAINDEFDILFVFIFARIDRIDDETPFVYHKTCI